MTKRISQLEVSFRNGFLFLLLVLFFVPQAHAGKKVSRKVAAANIVKKPVKGPVKGPVKRIGPSSVSESNAQFESLEDMVRTIEARNDLRVTYRRAEIEEAPTVKRVPSSAQMGPPERVSLDF